MERGAFVGIFFGVFFLVFIFMMFFAMKMRKNNLREKKEKLDHKLDLEIKKNKADFELEQSREKSKPIFCQYCGAKNEREAQHCTACGANLK